jgi:hypothetical protein
VDLEFFRGGNHVPTGKILQLQENSGNIEGKGGWEGFHYIFLNLLIFFSKDTFSHQKILSSPVKFKKSKKIHET